jgi:octopine/nopaline transport system permease protein
MHVSYFELIGFGPSGWGAALLAAAGTTLLVAAAGFLIGSFTGVLVAWAKIAGAAPLRIAGEVYTTVLRGVPDLLVIYLFYFGGSQILTGIAGLFGVKGFVGVSPFASGALAIGIVSGAYQSEVFRGAYSALSKGQIEAARSVGMNAFLMLRRVVGPQVLAFALPGLGNVWQQVLKESALVSVTGLMELLYQTTVAAGATYRPFDFYLTAMLLYLAITWGSGQLFNRIERRTMRGMMGRA